MKSILVIDDSRDTRDIVDTILSDAGYDVVSTGCTAEAFEALSNDSFDLLICDLHMPFVLDQNHFDYQYSYEVGVRTIQELSWVYPTTPIIAISATVPWELPTVMKSISHIPALSKPFSPRVLLNTVEQALFCPQHSAEMVH